MTYLKNFFFSFLIVYFVNHMIPGIEPGMEKLPKIGGDLLFAIALGFLNASIYPAMQWIGAKLTIGKIALLVLVINFAAYTLLKIAPSLGVAITSFKGYCLGAILVALGSFLTNVLEMRRHRPKIPKPPIEPPRLP